MNGRYLSLTSVFIFVNDDDDDDYIMIVQIEYYLIVFMEKSSLE
jgi:hypothetical protein